MKEHSKEGKKRLGNSIIPQVLRLLMRQRNQRGESIKGIEMLWCEKSH